MRDQPDALHPTTEETIFTEALALPPAMRRTFVDQSCEGDLVVAARVMALLDAYQTDGAFLDMPAPAAALRETGIVASAIPDPAPGDHIGRYRLVERIGEGGCGIVYGADQLEPVRRRVALKLIRFGMDTREFIARFEAEQQALALMDHPNIAHVYDAGATPSGRPYLVMELVRGIAITRFCDEHQLSLRARLELFVEVCGAIQHAHQKGVIHRDLKPSNILVASNEGVPVPKVIDFGIAKATSGPLTDKTLFTQLHSFMGTPSYMSPEQTEIGARDVDTRSDVYSLGALFYELLTGCPPHDRAMLERAGFDEMRRIVREIEPARPSNRISALPPDERAAVAVNRDAELAKLSLMLRSELDWIVMRCLEKDRARRYETANALAQDIRRHLENVPVVARPPSRGYRVRKFIRRYRVPVIAVAAVVVSLVGGLIATGISLVRENVARERAVAAERASHAAAEKSHQVAQFMKDMLGGVGPSVARGRDTTLLREVLDTTIRRLDTELRDQPEVAADLRHTLGVASSQIGDYDRAVALWREAIAMRRALGDTGSIELAVTLHELGDLLGRMDQVAEAEAALVETLAIRRRILGSDHFDVGTTLAAIANNIGSNRSAEERVTLLCEAVAIQRTRSDRGDELAKTLMILGSVLARDNRHDEAETSLRESVAIRRALGDFHPHLAESLGMLARALSGSNPNSERNRQEELLLRREVLQIVRQVRGLAHAKLIEALLDFTAYQFPAETIDDDLKLARDVFDELRKVLPEESPDVAAAQLALASAIDLAPGRSAEAEALARDARTCLRRARENGARLHPDTSIGMLRFVQRIQERGRLRYALPMAEELDADVKFASRQSIAPPSGRMLGRIYFDLGRFAEAAELMKTSALTERISWRPVQREMQFVDFAYAGDAYRKLGRLADSRQFLELGLARKSNNGDPSQAACAAVRGELGYTAMAEGNWAEAERLFREALGEYNTIQPIYQWNKVRPRGRIISGLGQSLAGQGKLAEAEPLLVAGFSELVAQRHTFWGDPSWMLREALEAVVQFYRAAGKPDLAAEWELKRNELEVNGGVKSQL